MVELTVVLPAIFLVLFGLAQTAMTISQVFMLSNISYEALIRGTFFSDSGTLGQQAMEARFAALQQIYSTEHSTHLESTALDQHGYETSRRVVLQSSANVTRLFSYLDNSFSIKYMGPMLLTNPQLLVGNLQEFSNVPNCRYDCEGHETCPSSASSAPCRFPLS